MMDVKKISLSKILLFILLSISLIKCDGNKKSDFSDTHKKASCFNPSIEDDYDKTTYIGESDTLHISIGEDSNSDPTLRCKIEIFDKSQVDKINLPTIEISAGDQYSEKTLIFTKKGEHELTIQITDLKKRITKNFQYNITVLDELEQSGKILYHATFPFSPEQPNLGTLDLSDTKFTKLILSNFIAGVLLGHLLKEQFPMASYNKDYVYGSIFAQLLQENIDTRTYPGGLYINNDIDKKTLLTAGQGGPYQLNDYSKRLPDSTTQGSLGLVNFLSLQASLDYSIKNQDSGKQTKSQGPDSLDNIYFGPIAASYFHYNDINRLNIINQVPWGPEKDWESCKKKINNGQFNFLDIILNTAYNAGTYSDILKTYINLCANPDKFKSSILKIDDYTLSDNKYIKEFQLGEGFTSLPDWYKGTTFIIYPRQVRLYLDQLFNNSSRIRGVKSLNNSVKFTLGFLKDEFEKSMATLGYLDGNTYKYISKESSDSAFTASLEEHTLEQEIDLGNASQRDILFEVLENALNKLETNLNFKFTNTTEEDHSIHQEL